MRILVLYYSFTGNTRRVCTALAAELGADLGEITCPTYGFGLSGGLLQAWHVFTGGTPSIELPSVAGVPHDLIIVAGPVWGARPAPPVRALVRHHIAPHSAAAVVLTCNGTSARFPGEKALAEVEHLLPRKPVLLHLLKEADILGPDFDRYVKALADRLRQYQASPSAG